MSVSVYARESIRDSFISGPTLSTMRQPLLGKHTLTFDEVVQHSRSHELEQRSAESYHYAAPSSASVTLSAASSSILLKADNVADSSCKVKEETNSSVATLRVFIPLLFWMRESSTFVDATPLLS